jgi:prefoldin subunit 5
LDEKHQLLMQEIQALQDEIDQVRHMYSTQSGAHVQYAPNTHNLNNMQEKDKYNYDLYIH